MPENYAFQMIVCGLRLAIRTHCQCNVGEACSVWWIHECWVESAVLQLSWTHNLPRWDLNEHGHTPSCVQEEPWYYCISSGNYQSRTSSVGEGLLATHLWIWAKQFSFMALFAGARPLSASFSIAIASSLSYSNPWEEQTPRRWARTSHGESWIQSSGVSLRDLPDWNLLTKIGTTAKYFVCCQNKPPAVN